MGIHNPIPSSMESECKKCGRILQSFVDPLHALSPDRIIPPFILARAKGLAVITVVKAGLIGSARFGSGVVVARLPDGTWSAPSAVVLAGGGVGQQIGFQVTDFVFILNDSAAVRTFSQAGSLTLGGNLTVTAGPVGRTAEVAATASLKGIGGILSYSKTKGFFAGISVEGSAIVERRDANEKLYGSRYTAAQLLKGRVGPPPAAMQLMSVLNSRNFGGIPSADDFAYSDTPPRDDPHEVATEVHGIIEGPKQSSTSKDDVYSKGPIPIKLGKDSVVGPDKKGSSNTSSKAPVKFDQLQNHGPEKVTSWKTGSDNYSWAGRDY